MIDVLKRVAATKIFLGVLAIAVADVILRCKLTFLWPVPLIIFLVLPGIILFQLIIRGRVVAGLSHALYGTGLGLCYLLINGLLLNELGKMFGVKSPLTTGNILLLLHGQLLLFLIIYVLTKRGALVAKNTNIWCGREWKRTVAPRISDGILWLLTGLFILLTIGGVNLLNNGGGNWLSMTAVALAALIPIVVVLLHRRIHTSTYLVTLFSISLGLLLLTSLRSHYLVGSDVLNEFGIAQMVQQQGFWSITQVNNTYNACLSITVLPQVLRAISGVNTLIVFRDIVQVVFSIAPVILFSIARNYLNPRLAYLSAISFLVFINYNGSLPNHIRQEVGLLFFMFIVITIISKELPRYAQKILVVLFSMAMVVSHYSTAYIAIIIFVISSVINIALAVRRKWSKDARQDLASPRVSVINLRLTGVVILFSFFWYSQITPSSGGPAAYISSLIGNIVTGGYANQHADQTSLQDQFKLKHKAASSQDIFKEYLKVNAVETPYYHPKSYPPETTKSHLKPAFISSLLNAAAQLVKKVYKFLAIGGMVVGLWFAWRKKSVYDMPFVQLLAGSLAVIGVSFAVPSFTVDYDQERMFQQLLVILAIPLVYFAQLLLRRFRNNLDNMLIVLFLSFYLLISTSFIGQLTGGLPTPLQLNNSGTDYARYYVRRSEVMSAQWIEGVHRYQAIYADGYAMNRLNFATKGKLRVEDGLLPGKFLPGAFIYYDSGNVINNITYASFNNGPILYTAPTDYLNQNTNLIYANGGSAVYAKPY